MRYIYFKIFNFTLAINACCLVSNVICDINKFKYTETSGPDTLPKPDTSLDRTVFLSPVLFITVSYQ